MDKGKLLNKIGLKAFLMPEERDAKKGKTASAAGGGGGASQHITSPAPKQPAGGGASGQNTSLSSAPKQTAAGGTAASCIYQYRSPAPLIYQVDPNTDAEEAMKLHDGVLIKDYSQNKSTAMAY